MSNDRIAMKLDQLIEADGASFTDLVALAELDPGRDFRGADLRGVDFTACNLAGYDFSQADLSGANLSHAQIGGAIFDGAQTTGTWWPHGGPPASTGLRLVRSGPPLHACQIEIVHSVISALLSGVMQSLVSMPVGTGRVEVMAALIEALDESDGLRTVVVLTDRVVLKEQFLSRMRDAFGQHVAELRSSRRQMSTPSPRILVGIAAAVLNAKNSKRDTQLLQNGRISHVLVDNFGRFPVILSQEVGDVFAESKVIGFTELSISEFQNRAKFDST